MIGLSFTTNTHELERELDGFRENIHQAGAAICDRMGLAAEVIAVELVHVASGRARDEVRWTGARRTADGHSGYLVAFAEHSLYLELGFQGHFVPFSVSEGLYRQALTRWGWRPTPPEKIPASSKPGDKWLIPRGRKNPVKGVMIRGDAHPFLRPAIREVNDTLRDVIIRSEIEAAILRSRVT